MRYLWGSFYLSAASAIWGGMYVVSKYVLNFVPPMTLVNIRMAIASVVLGMLVLFCKEKRVAKVHLKDMAWLGFIGFTVSIGSQFIGTQLSTASMGAIITSAAPGFIVLFAWLINKEEICTAQIAGLILSTAGVLVIVGMGGWQEANGMFLGICFLSIAAVTWALYTVLARRMANTYSALVVTCYAAIFGTFFTIPATLWELGRQSVFFQDWHIIAGILYLGIISTALAFYLWNKGFTYVSAGTGAVYFFLQPVFGSLLSWLCLGEQISATTVAGAAIIFVGVACSTFTSERRTANSEQGTVIGTREIGKNS